LEKNRDYTTCSFIRNTGLYRNTYGSIFITVLLREYSFVTLYVKQCNGEVYPLLTLLDAPKRSPKYSKQQLLLGK